jgi:hypothetical protein
MSAFLELLDADRWRGMAAKLVCEFLEPVLTTMRTRTGGLILKRYFSFNDICFSYSFLKTNYFFDFDTHLFRL